MILSPHEIAYLVLPLWTDAEDRRKAVAIFLAESSGNTDAIARSTTGANLGQRDHGLTQISGRWHGAKLVRRPDFRDPAVAVQLAREVYDETKRAGKDPWTAWSVYNSGSYLQYLPDADFGLAAPFPPPAHLASAADVAALTEAVKALTDAVTQSGTSASSVLSALSAETAAIRSHFS